MGELLRIAGVFLLGCLVFWVSVMACPWLLVAAVVYTVRRVR